MKVILRKLETCQVSGPDGILLLEHRLLERNLTRECLQLVVWRRGRVCGNKLQPVRSSWPQIRCINATGTTQTDQAFKYK